MLPSPSNKKSINVVDVKELFEACINNDLKEIRRLLKKKVDINSMDYN